MALMKMTNDISNEIDNKIFSIGIFIDLSKAFDTIDHKLFIKNSNTMELEVLHWNGLSVIFRIDLSM